jgi:putative pyruvate formate lyase activating enzyme
MDERSQRATELLSSCCLCERRCGADRTRGQVGACGCGAESFAYLEDLLWGEEEFLTPSYAVFFSGCNLRCAFCYAAGSNRCPQQGQAVEPAAVAARVRGRPEPPASFSFIGGEPTCHLPTALRVMAALPSGLPVVWNSNCYFTPETAELLAGAVDVYVADLHFGNDACAAAAAEVRPYFEIVTRNLLRARAQGELVVRLLVLPGHVDCCLVPSLAWLVQEMNGTPVHLMTDYLPPSGCALPELSRHLHQDEVERARELVATSGLRQVE